MAARDPARALDLETGDLVARLQAGDAAAFNELYERYLKPLHAYLTVALRSRQEAEDATQDVLVSMLRGLSSYVVSEVPFRVWLFRIARNHVIDRLVRRSRLAAAQRRIAAEMLHAERM